MRSQDRGLVLIRRRSSGHRHFNNPDERATVRKTGTFISIDKDGVNIQEIYCISIDLYIRIFPSPNLP